MFLNIKILFIGMLLLATNCASAQFDSSYVHITRDQFSIYPMTELHTSQFQLRFEDDIQQSEEIEAGYSTQNSLYWGFGMSFYRFGFALAFKAPYSNIPELKKSKSFSFSGGYSFKKLYGELKLKNYHGLQREIVNYRDDTTISQITINKNIRAEHVGVAMYYFCSDKYNFDANFKNYNYQKKSAISLVLGSGFNYYSFFGKLDFADNSIADDLDIEKNIQVYSLKVFPGMVASLVMKKFYFSFLGTIGGAYNYNILDDNAVRHRFAPSFEMRSSIGYNNKNFFASLNVNYDYDLVFLRVNKLGINNYMLSFKIGMKLNSKYLGKAGRYL